MVLFIAIIVIILAVIVFALRGLFGIFPDNWEWVGIVLAGVGLLMAVPSIFQMTIGRPLLTLESYLHVQGAERTLQVLLKNPPIKSTIWRKLGVRRDTIQSLTVAYRINEAGSNQVIVPIRQARIYSDADPNDEGQGRIALPPTRSIAASILVAIWNPQKNKVFIPSDRLRQPLELQNGLYKVTIILSIEGEDKYVTGEFVVGDKADDLIWAKPVQSAPCKISSQV